MGWIFRKGIFKLKNFWAKSKSCSAWSGSYSSILQAGKDSSCITTVLLLAKTMMLRSCCFSWVSWYHSLITSESWVGIKVTCNTKWKSCWMDHRNSWYAKCFFQKVPAKRYVSSLERVDFYAINTLIDWWIKGNQHVGKTEWLQVSSLSK